MASDDLVNRFDILGLCSAGDCEVKYLGTQRPSRQLAYFSIQNALDVDLGTPPQELLRALRDNGIDWLLSQYGREIIHTVASRISTALTIDKNAALHWHLVYEATADYEIRHCVCTKRNPWTLGLFSSQWGWSQEASGKLKVKAEYDGDPFYLDISSASQTFAELLRTSREVGAEGTDEFINQDGFESAFRETVEEKKSKLKCRMIAFVTDFK